MLSLSFSPSLFLFDFHRSKKKKHPNILLTIRKSRLKYASMATFTTNHRRRPCLHLTQISHPRRNKPTNKPTRLVAFSMALRIGRKREKERRKKIRWNNRFTATELSPVSNFRAHESRPDTLSTRLFFSLSNLLTPLLAAALLFSPPIARASERGKGSA